MIDYYIMLDLSKNSIK